MRDNSRGHEVEYFFLTGCKKGLLNLRNVIPAQAGIHVL
jgi:hypothetical protein